MFIRRTTHTDKKNKKEYHTFKLIESVRTERGPRQRMLLNLGTNFSLPEERWKDLANRIEEIVTGQNALFAYPGEIETLADRYARKVIDYHGASGGKKEKTFDPDYHRVDIDTIDNERSRSVGAEHVVYETIKSLGLDDLLGCHFAIYQSEAIINPLKEIWLAANLPLFKTPQSHLIDLAARICPTLR